MPRECASPIVVRVMRRRIETIPKARWRRATAALAAASLLFQLLIAAFAAPGAFAAARPALLPEGYSLIVICSGSGMRRVVIDAAGKPVGQPGGEDAGDCAVCHFTGCAALAVAAAPGLSLPAFFPEERPEPLRGVSAGGAEFLCPDPRAPPFRL